MKLTILNGSPRGKNSNSSVISKWIIEGIGNTTNCSITTVFLNRVDKHETAIGKMQSADMILLVFPLYTDCMPGIVMSFIEKLEQMKVNLCGRRLGFIVHSGFPEAYQSRAVEQYLVWLAEKLQANYIGTAILGGSEGIQVLPDRMIWKKRMRFNELGKKLIKFGNFDPGILKKIAGRERLSKAEIVLYKVMSVTGMMNYYWNKQLKKNKAYKTRFARPYTIG